MVIRHDHSVQSEMLTQTDPHSIDREKMEWEFPISKGMFDPIFSHMILGRSIFYTTSNLFGTLALTPRTPDDRNHANQQGVTELVFPHTGLVVA